MASDEGGPGRGRRFTPKDGKLTPDAESWVNTWAAGFQVRVIYSDDDDILATEGPDVRLNVAFGPKFINVNLSAMTEVELDATQAILARAIETARPIVQHRDRHAREAYENGDPSFARNYRAAPTLYARARQKRTDDQGVFVRPTANVDALRKITTANFAGGVFSDPMAERHALDNVPGDDKPKGSRSPSPWSVKQNVPTYGVFHADTGEV